MNPFPLILSSPSGGGKTTIARMLLERRSDVGYSVSCTTRPPREGEIDGRDYHFLTMEEFDSLRARGEFAEWARVHGHYYGTLRQEVERVLASGRHVILAIDVQGARQLAVRFAEAVLVFLLPPSIQVLLERLGRRNTENPEELVRRMRSAREELRAAVSYHYVVVNDDLERTYSRVASILEAEEVRHARLPDLSTRVARLVEELDQRILNLSRSR
jgi:guanylate kinase